MATKPPTPATKPTLRSAAKKIVATTVAAFHKVPSSRRGRDKPEGGSTSVSLIIQSMTDTGTGMLRAGTSGPNIGRLVVDMEVLIIQVGGPPTSLDEQTIVASAVDAPGNTFDFAYLLQPGDDLTGFTGAAVFTPAETLPGDHPPVTAFMPVWVFKRGVALVRDQVGFVMVTREVAALLIADGVAVDAAYGTGGLSMAGPYIEGSSPTQPLSIPKRIARLFARAQA